VRTAKARAASHPAKKRAKLLRVTQDTSLFMDAVPPSYSHIAKKE
jgi:hypothetical protein